MTDINSSFILDTISDVQRPSYPDYRPIGDDAANDTPCPDYAVLPNLRTFQDDDIRSDPTSVPNGNGLHRQLRADTRFGTMPVVVVENLYARTEHTVIADSNLLMGADHAIAVEIASFPNLQYPLSMHFEIAKRCNITVSAYVNFPLPEQFQPSKQADPLYHCNVEPSGMDQSVEKNPRDIEKCNQ